MLGTWNASVRTKSIIYIHLCSNTLPNFPPPWTNYFADSLLGGMTLSFIPEAYKSMISVFIQTVVPAVVHSP